MNGFIRGALGLALAATAGLAIAQPYGPPLAGGYPDQGPPSGHMRVVHDDMPGPDRQVDPRRGYDAYGFDRMGLTADGYDRHGYDAHGYDRYGFDPNGFNGDGYDRYGYDENGRDRYGRPAPVARHGERGRESHGRSETYGFRDGDRYGPPAGYDPEAWPPGRAYGANDYGSGESYGDDRYDSDRYGPAPDDRYAYDPEVPSYGGAMQHFADPRCSTCRPGPVRYDCGCHGAGYGYETSSISVNPGFFYDTGGVGPIPDGGSYGGGGYMVMGGGGFAGARSSASAYASSSSRVSIGIRTGGGGHHGGGHGGCNSCGGHK